MLPNNELGQSSFQRLADDWVQCFGSWGPNDPHQANFRTVLEQELMKSILRPLNSKDIPIKYLVPFNIRL